MSTNDMSQPGGGRGESDASKSANIPFGMDLLDETERHHRQMQMEDTSLRSFSLSGAAAPATRNPPERVRDRLRRLGLSADRADALTRVPPGTPSFAVISDAVPEDLASDAAIGLERIFGRNEMIGVAFFELGAERSRTVGRILVNSKTFGLDPEKFFVTSPTSELDFTLVAVRETSLDEACSLAEFGFNRISDQGRVRGHHTASQR